MTTPLQPTVEMLADARDAYHALITGRAARVVVDQNGEKVEFVAASRQQLYLYIVELERALGLGAPAISRGPARVFF